MSATLTTVSSQHPCLRLRRASAAPQPAQAEAQQPVPPALVARKVRDLVDLDRRLGEAAASCEKRGDALRAASYADQAAAVRAELAQWNALAAASPAEPVSPASTALSAAATWPAALAVLLFPLVPMLCETGQAFAKRRASQAGAVLVCVLLALLFTATSSSLNLATLHSLALPLTVPSSMDASDDEQACDAPKKATTIPRHWAKGLAPEVLRRKQGATPDLCHAMRTRR